jgi:hypothetical protein
MNYKDHYDRLIAKPRRKAGLGYTETHHIVPRCMGGSEEADNKVELTPEEHFLAHLLLVKMYPTEKWLAVSAMLMGHRTGSNKVYGWLRRRHAETMRQNKWTVEAKARLSANTRGKPKPESMRAKLMGNQNWRSRPRKPHSAEHRAKIAEAMRGNSNRRKSLACMTQNGGKS